MEAGDIMIKLEIVDRDNKRTDITQLVERVTWSGDYKQAARKLEFTIISNRYDNKIPKVSIKDGFMVFFYENNKELFCFSNFIKIFLSYMYL